MAETLDQMTELKWSDMYAELAADGYNLWHQGKVHELELIGRNAYQPQPHEPMTFVDTYGLQDGTEGRLEQFNAEMQYGVLSVTEGITGSEYDVVCLNRDFRDYLGWEDRNAIFVSLPFTSSFSTDQGKGTLWQISQRFPRNLVVAVGNEGTPDVRVNRKWLDSDLHMLTGIRHQCLHEALREHGALDENEMPAIGVDLVGQSMGAMFSAKLAEQLQQNYVYNTPVDRVVLTAPPINYCSTLRLANDVLKQETGTLLRSSSEERTKIVNHLSRHVLPGILGKDATRKMLGGQEVHNARALRRLAGIIANAHMRAEHLDGMGVETTFIAGSEDTLSPPEDFLASKKETPPDAKESDDIRAIVAKGEKHSNWLLNEVLCGRAIETALRWDEIVSPKAAISTAKTLHNQG